jgi:hypothetical protein
MLPSSWIERRVVRMRIYVSKERITTIFRVINQPSKKPAYSKNLKSYINISCSRTHGDGDAENSNSSL